MKGRRDALHKLGNGQRRLQLSLTGWSVSMMFIVSPTSMFDSTTTCGKGLSCSIGGLSLSYLSRNGGRCSKVHRSMSLISGTNKLLLFGTSSETLFSSISGILSMPELRLLLSANCFGTGRLKKKSSPEESLR